MYTIGYIFEQFWLDVQNSNTRLTWFWWFGISLASLCNISYLPSLVFCPKHRPINSSPRELSFRKWTKVSVTCWIIACSLRSFFPAIYAHRVCFFSFQSPALNRALAFVAECSFPIGVSAAFKFYSSSLQGWRFGSQAKGGHELVERLRTTTKLEKTCWSTCFLFWIAEKFVDFSIVLVFFANICCNLGALSTNHWWFVIEESCWFFYCCGLMIICIFMTYQLMKAVHSKQEANLSTLARADIKMLRRIFFFSLLISVSSCILIGYNDLPELRRFALQDCDHMLCPEMFSFDFVKKFEDVRRCHVVTRDWEAWKYTASWQTPYFTIGVWCVMWFASCPGVDIFRTKRIN